MSVVTIGEAWPGFGGPFTVAELDRMPSDGHRYELMDGVLVVGPRPPTVHLAVAGRLAGALGNACPEGLCVLAEPAVQLDPATELDPDLVVVHLDEVGGAKLTTPPLLVVEVRLR
jgi:Uma2 family endonuclease